MCQDMNKGVASTAGVESCLLNQLTHRFLFLKFNKLCYGTINSELWYRQEANIPHFTGCHNLDFYLSGVAEQNLSYADLSYADGPRWWDKYLYISIPYIVFAAESVAFFVCAQHLCGLTESYAVCYEDDASSGSRC